MFGQNYGVRTIYGRWYAGHKRSWVYNSAQAARFSVEGALTVAEHLNSKIEGEPYYVDRLSTCIPRKITQVRGGWPRGGQY